MIHGWIKWYDRDKRFGMIALNRGGDVFILSSTVEYYTGQQVVFDPKQLPSGHILAQNIRRVQ
jgi:cold shock CspA family protein